MIAVGFVALAALGGLVRWRVWQLDRIGRRFGILAINLAASFAAGWATGLDDPASLLVAVAQLGALSTWSTVVSDASVDWRHGHRRAVVGTVAAAAAGGVALAWLGLQLA